MTIPPRNFIRSLSTFTLLMAVATTAGCASSSSSNWAQLAPAIEAGGTELALSDTRTQARPDVANETDVPAPPSSD